MTTTPTPPTWRQEKELLLQHLELTEPQVEEIRRAGARRRHKARVVAARQELTQLLERIVPYGVGRAHRAAVTHLVCEAIMASIACIGVPGSSCGTSPPSWYRNTRHVGARAVALVEAMGLIATELHGVDLVELRVHVVGETELVLMDYQLDEPTVGVVNPEWGPEYRVLAEHLASIEIGRRARAVEAWLAGGAEGPAPIPPPHEVVEFHLAMVQARRERGGSCLPRA